MGFVLQTINIYSADLHHTADLIFLINITSVLKKLKAFLDCESSLGKRLKRYVK